MKLLNKDKVILEKEIDEVVHNYKLDNDRHTSICSADIEWIAQHFFELGVKQKEENYTMKLIDKELIIEKA